MKRACYSAGVSLLELMVVISIVAILTAIGVPSYKYVTTANRISAEINGLMGDLQFARYEAIREGLPVTICPAAPGATVCDNTTAWQEGWIVISTTGTNTVLRRQTTLATDTLTSTSAAKTLQFNREGFVTLSSGGAAMLSLRDPSNNAGYTRCLMLSSAGAAATTTAGKSMFSTTCS
jgi:type IV fimbrial biogenesis protein FimT